MTKLANIEECNRQGIAGQGVGMREGANASDSFEAVRASVDAFNRGEVERVVRGPAWRR